ncbi:hypothetical protein V7793_04715 [Streptomyces sp. KLMMK]|uniref:hypothetical protein n=1 Tax=Streptomyces sp. KLMMK TaxID=3109353 RepID=UPI002FFE555A
MLLVERGPVDRTAALPAGARGGDQQTHRDQRAFVPRKVRPVRVDPRQRDVHRAELGDVRIDGFGELGRAGRLTGLVALRRGERELAADLDDLPGHLDDVTVHVLRGEAERFALPEP